MSKWINPPLHIICGRCGNKNDLCFEIDPDGNCDTNDNVHASVSVICNNCNTLTGLDEVIPQTGEKVYKKRYSEEDMREAIAETWLSYEDNEDNETFTEVFNRILKTLNE